MKKERQIKQKNLFLRIVDKWGESWNRYHFLGLQKIILFGSRNLIQ